MITIYTDGSNVYNGKPYSFGGCGFVVMHDNVPDAHVCSGQSYAPNLDCPVTNNRMELLAVIHALEFVEQEKLIGDEPSPIIYIFSDSQWVVNIANREWKIKANRELWSKFFALRTSLTNEYDCQIVIQWVKGHVGNVYNEMADDVAGKYCERAKPSIDELTRLKKSCGTNIL